MKNNRRITNALILSGVTTTLFIPLITIVSDLQPQVKTWLKTTFSHHWVGKGILSLILFFVISALLYIVPQETSDEKIQKGINILFWTAVLGTVAIFGFYLYETLHAA